MVVVAVVLGFITELTVVVAQVVVQVVHQLFI
jgi:hypothetical protein